MQDQSASSRLLDHDALDAGEWSLEYPGSMSDRDSLVLVDRHAMIDRGVDRGVTRGISLWIAAWSNRSRYGPGLM